jgi:hypothetical protein
MSLLLCSLRPFGSVVELRTSDVFAQWPRACPLPTRRWSPKWRRRRLEVKPKYRDPATGETWSGPGRMANWLKRKLDAGEDIEKYRV